MKTKQALLIFLLTLAVSPALAQTWFQIVPAESQTLSVTVPAGSTVRWGNPAANVWSPSFAYPAPANFTAYCPDVANCAAADATDGLYGFVKAIYALETAAPQTFTLTDSSVSPAKVTTVVVPALPPTTYPPITFTPNVSYTFTVSASSTSPRAGAVTISIGSTSVPLNCQFGNTVMTGTTQAAVFTCIPSPIAAK